MSEHKLVYIASPYAGDVLKNIEFAKAACRYAMRQNCTPVAVHLLYPQFLDDNDLVQRSAGLTMGHRVLLACDELWVCGERISSGMAAEITEAKSWVSLSGMYPPNKYKEVLQWIKNMAYGRCAALHRSAVRHKAGASKAASRWSLI